MLSSLQPRSRPPLRWSHMTKKARFALILAAAMLVTVLVSLVVRAGFLGERAGEPLALAVVGPLSGPDAALGLALRKGAALRADTINAAGGIGGRPVEVRPFDDEGDKGKSLEIARRIANDPAIVAVVGHTPDATDSAAAIYAQKKIPLIAPRPLVRPADGAPSPWLFSIGFDRTHEIRFLANYVRNVVGEPTVAIIHEELDRISLSLGLDLVERLHDLDQADHVGGGDGIAIPLEFRAVRRGLAIERSRKRRPDFDLAHTHLPIECAPLERDFG